MPCLEQLVSNCLLSACWSPVRKKPNKLMLLPSYFSQQTSSMDVPSMEDHLKVGALKEQSYVFVSVLLDLR